jgi:hypothetical protein
MSLRGMLFDMESLEMVDKGAGYVRVLGSTDPWTTDRIVALDGFLDDSFFNGSFWVYKRRYASILALDNDNLYGVNIYSSNRFKSSGHVNFYPGEDGITLFAASIESTASEEGSRKEKGKEGKGRNELWTSTIPIEAKSLLVGSDRLYLAGVRDKVDEEDRWAHFDGRRGGLILVCSKADGRIIGQMEVESPPVFDGLASAGGKLFVSCKDGSVLCYE